jgi:hypothetical protein
MTNDICADFSVAASRLEYCFAFVPGAHAPGYGYIAPSAFRSVGHQPSGAHAIHRLWNESREAAIDF